MASAFASSQTAAHAAVTRKTEREAVRAPASAMSASSTTRGADGGRQVAARRGSVLRARARRRRGGDRRLMASARSSDLEQLGFLVLEQLVDGVDVLLGDRRRAASPRR